MFAIVLTILLSFLPPQTGTVVGTVKLPDTGKSFASARVVLLPPKYTEVWNKQVQQRLDNYWELYKPEFAANKQQFAEFDRIAYVESFNFTISTMRRDLGDGASRFIKESTPAGQFEFREVPFGTYQLLVQARANGRDVVWSSMVDVQTDIPIFVDLGKPVS
jgi:hypothetical protein